MPNARKTVLFFVASATGGAERMTITIAKMLPLNKYRPVLYIIDKNYGNISSFIPDSIEWKYVHIKNIWDFTTLRILKILIKEKPYAVFCSLMYMSIRVLLAAKIRGGIRTVIRNNNYWKVLRWDQKLLCKCTFKFADIIIAQQDEMRQQILEFLNVDASKVITLHNPIDYETIIKKSDVQTPFTNNDGFNYVCVARFSRNKGQDILIKAFTEVYRKQPKAHMYFVGDYTTDMVLFDKVKEIAKEANCLYNIHFIGFDENPYRWMKHCDCFVLPSRIEGLPNVLIEAQYLGTPSVATKCIPIIERIIENEVNGYVVESEDYQALADAMLKAVSLKKIKMTYTPSKYEYFIELF